ncbi:hypothetical protein SKAU_G00425850 [Synaphobranchus kaupii]|uniref:EGF-like domain-containing protein n=1 Tax=Synaphobranchus kaupii TaxID=118154 RepID=A0A9Q1E530_SYNKA|nr:hypothetical protein SKAU_G00425850 [Synaphobranchus kaupii]
MPESCVPEYMCGTVAPLWLPDRHPGPSEGIIRSRVCGHYISDCCWVESNPIHIKACPGNYFVYKFIDPSSCYVAYCAYRDECTKTPPRCGPNADCHNSVGGYNCSCHHGYENTPGVTLTNNTNPCQDVDECKQRPDICGPNASCKNTMGNYTCQCNQGYIPTPKLQWEKNNTTCANVTNSLEDGCKTAVTLLNWILGTQDELVEKNLVELGNTVLQFTQKLLSTQVELPITQANLTIHTEGMDAMTFSVGPNNTLSKEPQLWTNENAMDISLRAIASNNNGTVCL